jgi:hypothetical protein
MASAFTVLPLINFAFGILISTYLSLGNDKKTISTKNLKINIENIVKIVSNASLTDNFDQGKYDYLENCYKRWITENIIEKDNQFVDKQFPLQKCEAAWYKTFTLPFTKALKYFYNTLFGISREIDSNNKKLIDDVLTSFFRKPNAEYYRNQYLKGLETDDDNFFNNFNFKFNEVTVFDKTILYSVLVSILLIVLPYFFSERDTIQKWLSTQSNVL